MCNQTKLAPYVVKGYEKLMLLNIIYSLWYTYAWLFSDYSFCDFFSQEPEFVCLSGIQGLIKMFSRLKGRRDSRSKSRWRTAIKKMLAKRMTIAIVIKKIIMMKKIERCNNANYLKNLNNNPVAESTNNELFYKPNDSSMHATIQT